MQNSVRRQSRAFFQRTVDVLSTFGLSQGRLTDILNTHTCDRLWFYIGTTPIPVAERSRVKAWDSACCDCMCESRRAHGCLYLVSAVLSGRCLCDGPIPRPEKYYWVWVCHCKPALSCSARRKKIPESVFYWRLHFGGKNSAPSSRLLLCTRVIYCKDSSI